MNGKPEVLINNLWGDDDESQGPVTVSQLRFVLSELEIDGCGDYEIVVLETHRESSYGPFPCYFVEKDPINKVIIVSS